MENAGETRDSYGGDAEFVTCTVHPFRLLPLVPPTDSPVFRTNPLPAPLCRSTTAPFVPRRPHTHTYTVFSKMDVIINP